MASYLTAKEFGQKVGLEHTEVIRRIRKGDIEASKMGWFWLIPKEELESVKKSDWYQRVMKRRGLEASA